MLTHSIPDRFLAAILGVDRTAAERLLAGGVTDLDEHRSDRLSLWLNILTRLEVRCRGDGRLIREALDRFVGSDDPVGLIATIEGLRELRAAVATLPVPEIRMWRCASGFG